MTIKKSRSNAGKTHSVVKQDETVTKPHADVSEKYNPGTPVSRPVSSMNVADSGSQRKLMNESMPGKRVWPD